MRTIMLHHLGIEVDADEPDENGEFILWTKGIAIDGETKRIELVRTPDGYEVRIESVGTFNFSDRSAADDFFDSQTNETFYG